MCVQNSVFRLRALAPFLIAIATTCGPVEGAAPNERFTTKAATGRLAFPVFEPTELKGLDEWILVMDSDSDGDIWCGTSKGRFLRFNPRTRRHQLIECPGEGAINACLCARGKVYLLGRDYPKLRVYDRRTRTWREYTYPTEKANFWYGATISKGRYLILPNYSGETVLWDTQREEGQLIPYPFKGPTPGIVYVAEGERAAYSLIFEYFGDAAEKYKVLKWVRLDLIRREWSDEWPVPHSKQEIKPQQPTETAGEIIWHPHLKNGKMLGFDTKLRRFTAMLDIPGHGSEFFFAGSGNGRGDCGSEYRGIRYYSMSTYDGDDIGIDGKTPHYVNGLLAFDPATKQFDILRLQTEAAYHQTGFTLATKEALFFHSTNIRRPDGSFGKGLNDASGQVMLWQPAREKNVQSKQMALSALVSRPTAKAGLESWTVETRLPRASLRALACRPGGGIVATGGGDGVVRLWDANTGKLLNALVGHDGLVEELAWSPNGTLLASGGYEDRVIIWDARTGQILKTISCGTGGVYTVSWSPDGKLLATGGDGNDNLKIWNRFTGQLVKHLHGHQKSILSTEWSPDGNWLASAADDLTIRLWSTTDWKTVRVLKGHEARIRSIQWSGDSRRLISAGNAGTIRIWDAEIGRTTKVVAGHTDSTSQPAIYDLDWSPDGKTIASVGTDKTVRIWKLDGTIQRTLSWHDSPVMEVCWLGDGSRLVSVDVGGNLCLGDWKTGKLQRKVQSHHAIPNGLAWSPDSLQLAVPCEDSRIRVWTVGKEHVVAFTGPTQKVLSVAWSPDGKHLAGGAEDGTIHVWEVASGKGHEIVRENNSPVTAIAWSPKADGSLAAAQGSGKILLCDPHNGRKRAVLKGHDGGTLALDWSPDGRLLASGGADQAVHIWNSDTGKLQKTLGKHSSRVYSVSFSPNGQSLVSSSYRELWAWSVESNQEPRKLTGHLNWVYATAWSVDGRTLASVSRDRTLKLWDVQRGRTLQSLTGHVGQIDSMSWSPDGRNIATASTWDGTVRLWNARTGSPGSILLPLKSGSSSVVSAEGKLSTFPAKRSSEMVFVVRSAHGQKILRQVEFSAAGRQGSD
jgi:WD40 repeat protein